MNKSPFPLVYIIVLNFNGKSTLSDCLRAVYQSSYSNFEVVVVDNDSQDGSFEQARHDFSRAHFIKNSANVGFAQGNNIGIRYALEKFADFVFVLNNDAIIEKGTISGLIKAAEKNPSAGIISPLIYSADNQVWFAGGQILWNKMKTIHLTEIAEEKPYITEYVTGCAMFVNKEVFKKIGLFDERFFLYYEDADFSLRAKKADLKLLVDPQIIIKHFEQSTFSNKEKIYWLVLSGIIFFKSHASNLQKIWMFFFLILRKLKNLYLLVFSSSEEARQVRRAYRDYKKIPV